ncbi:MAG: dihydrolipoamide acetyltransferase family protein [Reyranella sp.]|uniref:dihydrolipoamide acetyltransferase family protein n=1 Tax=Reyranella sp. TaxID=1929291 RepID=UPI003D13F9B9
MSLFALPDLGEGLQEAEIVAWHVAEGDRVVAEQPLLSVETEKAVVEIPSPRAGRIVRLLARSGDRVRVGSPIVAFDEAPHADTGAIVGDLGPQASRTATSSAAPVMAAPNVRAMARELGVDIAQVAGSGPGGAVTRADVARVFEAKAGASLGGELKGVRRSMALNMARAHAEVVPATVWDEADIQPWWSREADVTGRLVRAIAVACGAVPALNAWFNGATMICRQKPQVDLGIAVDTEEGLVVPVLRDVGNRDAAVVRRERNRLAQAARNRTITLADMRHPTITLSNFGMLAGRQAALVVMPPQVAIVGAGRIFEQLVGDATGSAFHHMLPLSITFDHRAVTGGEAARFLGAMIKDLQQPK